MVKEASLKDLSPDDLVGYKPSISRDVEKQIKKLEDKNQQLLEQLSRARSPKFRLPVGDRNKKPTGKGSFCRVLIPDTHGCFLDIGAFNAFLADLKQIQPKSIILLGDHMDCGGFLAQHHTIGFVAEAEYTFEDDVSAANQMLDAIQDACPNAEIEYLEGNHELRIEKWIVTETLRNKSDSAFLRSMFSTEIVLSTEARGIKMHKQGVFHDGLSVPATIRRDGCYFTHGEFTGKNAASQHLNKYNGNVWYAHTHRSDMATKRTVKDGIVGAWNPGCLCRLQPLWMHTNLTDWVHGYGIQAVTPGAGHLNIQIPIIDGISYLKPLAASLEA